VTRTAVTPITAIAAVKIMAAITMTTAIPRSVSRQGELARSLERLPPAAAGAALMIVNGRSFV
jgi:hypothetical protein